MTLKQSKLLTQDVKIRKNDKFKTYSKYNIKRVKIYTVNKTLRLFCNMYSAKIA